MWVMSTTWQQKRVRCSDCCDCYRTLLLDETGQNCSEMMLTCSAKTILSPRRQYVKGLNNELKTDLLLLPLESCSDAEAAERSQQRCRACWQTKEYKADEYSGVERERRKERLKRGRMQRGGTGEKAKKCKLETSKARASERGWPGLPCLAWLASADATSK